MYREIYIKVTCGRFSCSSRMHGCRALPRCGKLHLTDLFFMNNIQYNVLIEQPIFKEFTQIYMVP